MQLLLFSCRRSRGVDGQRHDMQFDSVKAAADVCRFGAEFGGSGGEKIFDDRCWRLGGAAA
jgi:hypothetical protein